MKTFALAVLVLAFAAAACGQRSATPPATAALPESAARAVEPVLPADTIGIELPGEGLGTVHDVKFGLVGGFTQRTRSQIIAFKPGVTITIRNLSHFLDHTLNVLSTTGFPKNPTLSTTASGGTLKLGYRTGILAPGHTVRVVLKTPGTYFVGCAFHYPAIPSMRDVIKVSVSATPGPQATPTP